ncbi:hypothetical protein CLAFUW4_01368 [Fulvia fulva]|uniref:Uncharacterized protein n=1 Tax=Passalora fulva TaxID=5499 RepID=A0A9Q8L6P8_PASFU|nr:uncharacterized protein CLAFUR5_01371 [Fulvia fulva]KAK4635759.1 hypothetical protein CLAFUR4_01369 [Fulvia fulva]KAK4637063.1 hypothetical protein CLAFUR0_01370 [Fulvia fulva]UJO11724.1 hypothetical protein CLAFUR5_01371 [Fulvia fulva]WPV10250.1 hypothetical protein CLAFUW4_01368 [Fulvia fulva]WPV24308.1 hypothetical protein CLAFUW7_01373 [Fulvia fulva]
MAATNGGAWSYAVPLDEMDGNIRHLPHRRDTMGNPEHEGKKLQQLDKRPSAWDLMSDSETTKQRRTSMRQNNTTAGRKRSRNQLREMRQQHDENKKGQVPGVDDSAWIHRDKLAQIEIQEMADAGISVRRSRRSESAGPNDARNGRSLSRSSAHRPRSRTSQTRQNDISNDVDYANAYPAYGDESPRKRVSTVPSAPNEAPEPEPEPMRHEHHPAADADYNPYRDADFRNPEDVARERQAYKGQMARPSTSRIPVSRVTPVPVPKDIADRDSPLPRSRAGSQNWGSSFDEMRNARKIRSPSVSSAILLDSDPEKSEKSKTTPPGSSSNKNSSNDEYSPPKSRVPTKATPGSRKTSLPTATNRPGSSHQNKRAVSGATTQRPGSSSGRGHKSRPSTGRHSPPEGEAPWIASMYKPDPRLPPDEQMLPTHAKRMMQEQWEKEGKSGTIYDRDFNLLNDEEPPRPKVPILDTHSLLPPIPRSPSPEKNRMSPNGSANGGPWPLSPTKSDSRSENGSVRPGTSGGYKITPTIPPSSPHIHRSNTASPISPAQPPTTAHNTTPRVPDLDEKEEAKAKKACCCVVM